MAVSSRTGRAGRPRYSQPDSSRLPGLTRLPAASITSLSTTAPSMIMVCMPIITRSPTVQPCSMAWWPMVTSAPISRGKPPGLNSEACVMCSTALSWMLVRAPTRMRCMSPRTTAPGHSEQSSPSVTSPITVDAGST